MKTIHARNEFERDQKWLPFNCFGLTVFTYLKIAMRRHIIIVLIQIIGNLVSYNWGFNKLFVLCYFPGLSSYWKNSDFN